MVKLFSNPYIYDIIITPKSACFITDFTHYLPCRTVSNINNIISEPFIKCNMDLSDPLQDSLYAHIEQIKNWDFRSFTEEVDFIDEAVDTLDGFDYDSGNQKAEVKAKKMHPSPKVDFAGPNWNSNRQAQNAADWIENTTAELADIMIVVNLFESDQITERRVMLSQTKFSKEQSSDPWEWKIKMHQYYLLDKLPIITFTEPSTGESFNLNPENKTFTSYSFASDFRFGFFNSTRQMQDYMKSKRGIKTTGYDPTPDVPHGFQVFRGILKRFILGMYGETFRQGEEIYKMIQHMYDEASFERSVTSNTLTDGGQHQIEDPGMAVIQFDIGKEVGEKDFNDIDSEGPRL